MATADLALSTVQTSSGETQETCRNKVKERNLFKGCFCYIRTAVLVFVLAFV